MARDDLPSDHQTPLPVCISLTTAPRATGACAEISSEFSYPFVPALWLAARRYAPIVRENGTVRPNSRHPGVNWLQTHVWVRVPCKYVNGFFLSRVSRDRCKRPSSTVVQVVDRGAPRRYRMGSTRAVGGSDGATFHGSSSSTRLAGWSAMRSST